MSEGASLTSFAADIGVCRATINVWMAEYPQFLEAVNKGKAKCAAWWEKQARTITTQGGGAGSATLCVFGLRNMASDDWFDRKDPDQSPKEIADNVIKIVRAVKDADSSN